VSEVGTAVERQLSYDVRVIAMREAVDQFKTAVNIARISAHRLIDADLHGAVDIVSDIVYRLHKAQEQLESQYRALASLEAGPLSEINSGPGLSRSAATTSALSLTRTHQKGRRKGIDVVPGSVKTARLEAGMSLADVAGTEVTRVAIWYVEQGKVKPSLETLLIIAQRTNKPLGFFLAEGERLVDKGDLDEVQG